MSNEFLGDGQDDSGSDQETGKALREFGKREKARADKLEQELNEIRLQLAKRDADSVFARLGVPEKVRKFYTGDPTEDAIKDWVKENADVFGIEGDTPTPEQSETQQQIAAVQQAQSLGEDRNQSWTRDSMAQKRQGLLSTGTSLADLNAVLAEFGVPDIPVQGPMM